MIGVIVRERCRSDPRGDPRGWALMEPFCFGAAVLYAIVGFYLLSLLINFYLDNELRFECPIVINLANDWLA